MDAGDGKMPHEEAATMTRLCLGATMIKAAQFSCIRDLSLPTELRQRAFEELFGLIESEVGRLAFFEKRDPYLRKLYAAMTLLQVPTSDEPLDGDDVLIESSKIAPAPDKPEYGGRLMQLHEMEAMRRLLMRSREKFPDSWSTFFKVDSEPLEVRRRALAVIVDYIGSHLGNYGAVFQRLTQVELEHTVIIGMVGFVPRDQWTMDELKDLLDTMTPLCPADYESAEPGPLGL